ncbi:DUF3667 domain-containing protein [Sphingorhabdus sp.]|uniref:DUF3667 domain-containing protein n=1 Tax=Sphingorhabdus sp. TaxID=1902408 RepID=UPI003593B161
MNGELVGAADIITGAALARAVEPDAGEGRGVAEKSCLNCGATLMGAHCHNCGQKAHVHRTLHEFGHDILHSVLHFDGKIWRTLPMLFWKPGELTRRYVHGERAKFVSPLALFLFSVFLTFATFNGLVPDGGASSPQGSTANIEESRKELLTEMAGLESDIAAARKAGKPTQALEEQLKDQKIAASLMGTAANTFSPVVKVKGDWKFTDLVFPGADALNLAVKKAKQNPQLLLYKVQSNAYKYSWALIPISVPFVWLLFFWRRRFKLFDHAVFVTYSLSFMMMLVTTAAICIQYPQTEPFGALLLTFYPPIHMYRQIHQAYETSRFGAFWRMCFLNFFAITALILFTVLIVALGVT